MTLISFLFWMMKMQFITSLQAKNRFGELMDISQREPVVVTKHSRPVSAVISVSGSERDMRLQFAKLLREVKPLQGDDAVAAFQKVVDPIRSRVSALNLSDDDITRMIETPDE